MPRTSIETRRRILVLLERGFSINNIQKRLVEEQTYVSKVAIYKLIKKYKEHHIYTDLQRSPAQKPILNEEQVLYIDNAMDPAIPQVHTIPQEAHLLYMTLTVYAHGDRVVARRKVRFNGQVSS